MTPGFESMPARIAREAKKVTAPRQLLSENTFESMSMDDDLWCLVLSRPFGWSTLPIDYPYGPDCRPW